jgi:signal transduction histidine kinase
MIGFRPKLMAGFGSLLAILLVTGILAIALLERYSGTLDRIFRENYDSVRYGQEMKDALEEIERIAGQDAGNDSVALRLRVGLGRFERNFALERGNVTVPGEKTAVDSLEMRWKRHELLLSRRPAEQAARAAWTDSLHASTERLSASAQAVVDVNFRNILSVDGQVRRNAAWARRMLLTLLAGGVLLFLGLSSLVAAWVLRPVSALTNSVREIGRGNLDLAVPVPSRDELGELAEAFNAMAGKLRESRRMDRQRLWRVHRATQNAIDSLPDAVAVVAPKGEVEMGNKAARRLFSLDSGVRLEGCCEGRFVAIFRKAVESRKPVFSHGFDAAFQVFDERERFFLPHALPVLDGDGAVAGVTLVLADITQLRRLDEMKSGALSVVAHELRTPITSLRMASHLLLDERMGELSPRQEELAAGLREDSERLWRIVEELLDVGRMEAGSAALELAVTDVFAVVRKVAEERREAFRAKEVALDIPEEGGAALARVDAARLSLAVGNLLSNALRHTAAGGRVRVEVAPGEPFTISVIDTGEGIAPEHLPHLFERFYRAPGQSASSGVGLGLAIVREVVEAHGGHARAESRLGEGSRFVLELPSGIEPSEERR